MAELSGVKPTNQLTKRQTMNDVMMSVIKTIITKTKGEISPVKTAQEVAKDERSKGFAFTQIFAAVEKLHAEYQANPLGWKDFEPVKLVQISADESGNIHSKEDEADAKKEQQIMAMMATLRDFEDSANHPIPFKPTLIDGILRVGRVMILQSKAKASKSWMMQWLMRAFHENGIWLGRSVNQCNALLVDLELVDETLDNRICKIFKGIKWNKNFTLKHMALCGCEGVTYNAVFDAIERVLEAARKASKNGVGNPFDVVVIDPLYVLFAGEKIGGRDGSLDENSNSDMGELLSLLKGIARRQGVGIVFCHHFAKGNRTQFTSAERGSGAGSFSRSPDAILTLTPEGADGDLENIFRIEYKLREFETPPREYVEWSTETCRLESIDEVEVNRRKTEWRKKNADVIKAVRDEAKKQAKKMFADKKNDEAYERAVKIYTALATKPNQTLDDMVQLTALGKTATAAIMSELREKKVVAGVKKGKWFFSIGDVTPAEMWGRDDENEGECADTTTAEPQDLPLKVKEGGSYQQPE